MKLATSPRRAASDYRVRAEDPPPPVEHASIPQPGLLDSLYRANAPRLLRFFTRRTSRDEANDLLQETFTRLANLGRPLAHVVKPEAYLGTVATNLLRDRARAAVRQALEQSEPIDENRAIDADPHHLLEHRDTLARLETAVKGLSSRRRRIFLLHRLEHLTYAEIAAETGMSVKGVKTQMAKALFELRRVLGPL